MPGLLQRGDDCQLVSRLYPREDRRVADSLLACLTFQPFEVCAGNGRCRRPGGTKLSCYGKRCLGMIASNHPNVDPCGAGFCDSPCSLTAKGVHQASEAKKPKPS